MIGVAVLVVVVMLWLARRRPRVWHPAGVWPTPSAPLAPTVFPAQANGCWYDTSAVLWFSHAGPLVYQGPSTVRCDGDRLIVLHPRGTITVPWETLVGLHGHPNGILIHSVGLAPFVVDTPENGRLHAWLTRWMAHSWAWEGAAWVAD